MGCPLFGGGDCRDCKNRCDSWFPSSDGIRKGCRNLCFSGDTNFTRDEYLDSIGMGPEAAEAAEEAYFYDQFQATQEQQEFAETIRRLLLGAGGLLVLIVIIYFTYKYLKN